MRTRRATEEMFSCLSLDTRRKILKIAGTATPVIVFNSLGRLGVEVLIRALMKRKSDLLGLARAISQGLWLASSLENLL